MQWIRKYRQYIVGLSLAIFVLPVFSIFCQSCLDMATSEHSMAHQSDHSCCKQESNDSPAMVNGAGCCEPDISDSDTSSTVFIFADTQVEKFIRVSSIPLPAVANKVIVYRRKDPTVNLAYASLSFRNPVLLN